MSKKLYEESSISAIADAIRNKNGSSDSYKVSQMASAISQISPAPVLQAKTVTQNGIVLPDSGYDGLSRVAVNVESGGGGSSGVYVGENDPDNGLGIDGEYYYKRFKYADIFGGLNIRDTSGQQAYGYEFSMSINTTLSNFQIMLNGAGARAKCQFGTVSEILYESSYITTEARRFVSVDLPDIEVTANTHYIIKIYVDGSSTRIPYGSIIYSSDYITIYQNRYGSNYPGSTENFYAANNFIPIIFSIKDSHYRVNKEFYKSNGQWTEL